MYANQLVVAVKYQGKVLQEFGEVVYLPFGSEYSLLLKNLSNVRASVKVGIDGDDVTKDVALVVPPNSSIELERFIVNGNLGAGNRFKFIERNDAVAKHRGIKPDDGLIRVTFAFEIPRPQQIFGQSPVKRGHFVANQNAGASGAVEAAGAYSCSVAKGGVTAPGSVSHQQFQAVGQFQTGAQLPPIIIQLAGERPTGTVQSVVYTRTKVDCQMCGHKAHPTSKFCPECGAGLIIV